MTARPNLPSLFEYRGCSCAGPAMSATAACSRRLSLCGSAASARKKHATGMPSTFDLMLYRPFDRTFTSTLSSIAGCREPV